MFDLTERRVHWLQHLDRDPGKLQEYLAQRPTHRLGIYFEQLWQFFLQQDSDTELLAHNLPVHAAGKTLGEFDCLYYCHRRKRHVHLELAVKYFLAKPGTADTEWHNWLGPDNRDRLDLKLNQLLHRQIMLAENPAAKPCLAELGIKNVVKEVVLKGYLFRPLAPAVPYPQGYNRSLPLAYWLECNQLMQHCAALPNTYYQILPKMHWLSAAYQNDLACHLSADQLARQLTRRFNSESYPALVTAVNSIGQETQRFFVTPQHWPDCCS